jgi:hypothetical protein
LARQQGHRRDQDELAHRNPLHLANPPDLICALLAGEPMHADLDQGGPTGQAINQAEQSTQHDLTPLLIIGNHNTPRVFPAFFAG